MKKSKEEFHLENVYKVNKESPRTFLIPNEDEIRSIQIGDLVKIIFIMEEQQDDGCRAERMWVEISKISRGGFKGTLNNDPYYLKTISAGDEIDFSAKNIASIFIKEQLFDEKQFAIITKRAYENRQINWVVRTDDVDGVEDSGWQLFFGNEDNEYLDESSNAKLVTLEEVLVFEPLLEGIFAGRGNRFEYNSNENKFIEVN